MGARLKWTEEKLLNTLLEPSQIRSWQFELGYIHFPNYSNFLNVHAEKSQKWIGPPYDHLTRESFFRNSKQIL